MSWYSSPTNTTTLKLSTELRGLVVVITTSLSFSMTLNTSGDRPCPLALSEQLLKRQGYGHSMQLSWWTSCALGSKQSAELLLERLHHRQHTISRLRVQCVR